MADSSPRTHEAPEIPDPDQRLPIVLVNNPHPATLQPDELLENCGLRTQRRSGPGGQHRNKTSSGAFLHYPPTNTTAEATERRSQADNRRIALERLRFRLAVDVRSPSPIDGHEIFSEEKQLRKRYQGHSLKISDHDRMTDTGVIEPRAFSGQGIDVGGLNNGISIATQCAGGLVIRKEKYDVWLFRRLCLDAKRLSTAQQ